MRTSTNTLPRSRLSKVSSRIWLSFNKFYQRPTTSWTTRMILSSPHRPSLRRKSLNFRKRWRTTRTSFRYLSCAPNLTLIPLEGCRRPERRARLIKRSVSAAAGTDFCSSRKFRHCQWWERETHECKQLSPIQIELTLISGNYAEKCPSKGGRRT